MLKLRSQKAGALFIFITIALDTIGLGIVIPILPDVLRRFITDESHVSQYYGYFISLYALMQFVASPVLGKLSDRFGRRPVLLVSLFFSAIDYLLMAYAPTLSILFLGRIISGLTGASITVATAYIADVSTDENRAGNFGLIGAAFGLGFILGPAIGGLLGSQNPHYPFIAAALFTALNFIYGSFILPESLPPESRRKKVLDWKELNPFSSILKVLESKKIHLLVWAYVLFNMAGQVHPACWTLFTRRKFGWTPAQIGISLAVVGVLSAISQGWLTRIIIPKVGEWRAVKIGAWGEAASFFLFSIVANGTMMYTVLAVSSLFWIGQPALQSILTKSTPPEQQGELQGSLNSMASVTSIVSPLVATALFSYFSNQQGLQYLGAPYAYGALCFLVAALMITRRSHEV